MKKRLLQPFVERALSQRHPNGDLRTYRCQATQGLIAFVLAYTLLFYILIYSAFALLIIAQFGIHTLVPFPFAIALALAIIIALGLLVGYSIGAIIRLIVPYGS